MYVAYIAKKICYLHLVYVAYIAKKICCLHLVYVAYITKKICYMHLVYVAYIAKKICYMHLVQIACITFYTNVFISYIVKSLMLLVKQNNPLTNVNFVEKSVVTAVIHKMAHTRCTSIQE